MELSAPCQSKDTIGTQALIHERTAPEKQTQTLSNALINGKNIGAVRVYIDYLAVAL